MPRLSARRHSLRFLILYIHNLIEQERQVLRSPFMCVSLRKQLTIYTAAFVSALWVFVASHLTLLKTKNGFILQIQVIANVIPLLKSFNAACHQQVSAIPQCNKLHLLYRLTSERV